MAERTNDLIVNKAWCLFLEFDLAIEESFALDAFLTLVYLFNRSPSNLLNFECLIQFWLRVYHLSEKLYMPNISHPKILVCYIWANTFQKICVKSYKVKSVAWNRFLIRYTSKIIYSLYFPKTCMVKNVKNLVLLKLDNNNGSLIAQEQDGIICLFFT